MSSKIPSRIEHEGRVVEISETTISVEIISKSACAACHAKSVCTASDETVKVVEIPYTISTLTEEYQIGDRVNVVLRQSLGIRAIWIAYVVPLALLLLAIYIFSAVGAGELRTGLFSICVVALYYAVVFLFKNKLSKIFTFTIEKAK